MNFYFYFRIIIIFISFFFVLGRFKKKKLNFACKILSGAIVRFNIIGLLPLEKQVSFLEVQYVMAEGKDYYI